MEPSIQTPAKRRRLSPSASFPRLESQSLDYSQNEVYATFSHNSKQNQWPAEEHSIAEAGADSEIVCFGTIFGIRGTIDSSSSSVVPLDQAIPVTLCSSDRFMGTLNKELQGMVDTDWRHITSALIDEKDLELQVQCIDMEAIAYVGSIPSKRSARLPPQSAACSLAITMYGPLEMFKDIGDFFESNEMFIQDPERCDRKARYCNPHRLSSLNIEDATWTSEFNGYGEGDLVELKDVTTGPELLEVLDSQSDLAETEQSLAITTDLKRHQKQALTFMVERERGWTYETMKADLWDVVDTGRGRFFINRVSNSHQIEEPDQFCGGIIADPMGFGKTLTMIALIARDTSENLSDMAQDVLEEEDITFMDTMLKQTLVVVPPPLLDTWEEQLSDHVNPGTLTWRRHHGKTRVISVSDLQGVNIVLTTYHTVAADWKSHASLGTSILFASHWKRLVLDEAHIIRNSNSQMAKALCALNATCRWAVTGTPIQNRLKDFSALLKFLQVHPYSDQKKFDADVSSFWKSGNVDEAIKRLKSLSGCLLLRRPQGTVELPARRDMHCTVEFTPAERELYNSIRERAIRHIDDAKLESADTSGSGAYMNVLQQIEAMRMVCNLGLHYHSRHNTAKTASNLASLTGQSWSIIAQRIFNLHRSMASVQCHYCYLPLDAIERISNEDGPSRAVFSRCMRFVCADCAQARALYAGKCICDHQPCAIAPVSTTVAGMEDTMTIPASLWALPTSQLPTKVAALVKQLSDLPPGVKSVVFSTWRMSLDVVAAGLNQAGISCLRYDGKVPQKERHRVVERFRNDPTVTVLLLTLSCGAVGLTLTVASRAYLLEPHWNPTLEDQALARIHRMGQMQEVTTVRFRVGDTFEERVTEIQGLKKTLASLISGPRDEDQGAEDRGPLERLRALL